MCAGIDRHRQHRRERRRQVGAEISALGRQPDRDAAGGDARRARDRAQRRIGAALERLRAALRQIAEPGQHGGAKRRQRRRRIGDELAAGGAAAGLLEGDDRLARQDAGFAGGRAIDEGPQPVIVADRHPRAEALDRVDVPQSHGRGRSRCRRCRRGLLRSNAICAARGACARTMEALALGTRRAEDRGPAAHATSPWSNTRRASGRRLSDASSVRQTSSSPRA